MERIFCSREFKPEIKDRDTSEIEEQIKIKLQPIRIDLESKINKLVKEVEKKNKLLVILESDYPEIKVTFSVNIEQFNS